MSFLYGKHHLTSGKALAILSGKLAAKIDDEVKQKIIDSHHAVLDIANDSKAVYGINTGFGPLCNSRIDSSNTISLQYNLLLSHSVGVGKPIDKDLSKLMLILKVHSLAQGFSGISLAILDRILWHIKEDVIPVVPEQGSVGASGDLAPLSHLFLPLIGKGRVFYKGKIEKTEKVFQALGMNPVQLHPKCGLALINGTQFILAHAVMVVDQLYSNLAHADIIASLMIEGMLASRMPFHPSLHQTRPYKGNSYVAGRVFDFIKESSINASHINCNCVQDPYSLRCIPQVHGSSRSAWLHLKEAVEIELNAVTDNPVIFSRDFTISGGNFHGQPLALPLDYACLATAEIGNISDRRSYLSLEGKVEGTPKLLMENIGLHSGFMIIQYTSAALASENKGLCFPSSADSIPTSLGQEDHVSMGSIGGRKALTVCDNVQKILAAELLCATQALDFKRPLQTSQVLEAIHSRIRMVISHATEDRIFADDLLTAIRLLSCKDLLNITESFKNEPYSEYDDLFEVY